MSAPDPASTTDPAVLFAALGDETRLSLVTRLGREGPLSIASLTSGTGVTRQAVSKHLEVLSGAGIVSGVRLGREHIWQLERTRLDLAHRYLDLISAQWDIALESLRRHVEAPEPEAPENP